MWFSGVISCVARIRIHRVSGRQGGQIGLACCRCCGLSSLLSSLFFYFLLVDVCTYSSFDKLGRVTVHQSLVGVEGGRGGEVRDIFYGSFCFFLSCIVRGGVWWGIWLLGGIQWSARGWSYIHIGAFGFDNHTEKVGGRGGKPKQKKTHKKKSQKTQELEKRGKKKGVGRARAHSCCARGQRRGACGGLVCTSRGVCAFIFVSLYCLRTVWGLFYSFSSLLVCCLSRKVVCIWLFACVGIF